MGFPGSDCRHSLCTKWRERACQSHTFCLWAIFIALLVFVRSLKYWVARRYHVPDPVGDLFDVAYEPVPEERCFPLPAPGFTQADVLSSVLRWMGELEEKVCVLQKKSIELPGEKDELLNAAVYHVDALEAELILTKKALHEALIKQEGLLAYVDRMEKTKIWRKRLLLVKEVLDSLEEVVCKLVIHSLSEYHTYKKNHPGRGAVGVNFASETASESQLGFSHLLLHLVGNSIHWLAGLYFTLWPVMTSI